jgi:hypothetical protein
MFVIMVMSEDRFQLSEYEAKYLRHASYSVQIHASQINFTSTYREICLPWSLVNFALETEIRFIWAQERICCSASLASV